MSFLANRLKQIKSSPTMALSARVTKLLDEGRDIITLGAGEPDFDTADNVKDFAKNAIDQGDTKYTDVSGTKELKEAIALKFKKDNQLEFPTSQIIAGCGGKHVIFNAFMATLNEGDEVIIPAPYWVSYPDMVLLFGGKPVYVDCSEKNNFKLQPDDLAKVITEKTKWLIINSPCNPTGAVYSQDELSSLSEVLLKHPNVLVLSDDIYEHVIYDNLKFYTIAQIEPKLTNRTLTMNGVSKSYAMTGWRIGFAGGSQELISAMTKIQSQGTSSPSSISQAAAVEALNGDQSYVKERSLSFMKRRDYVVKFLNESPGINCLNASGTFYVYPSCGDLIGKKTTSGKAIMSDEDLAMYLLEEAEVAVVPGGAFGSSPFFRISFATSMKKLEEACERIKSAVRNLS